MPKTASLNIRIDQETKTGAEKLYAKLGITISDAVIMFLRQSLTDSGLPFRPSVKPTMDEQLIAALEKKPVQEYTLDVDEHGNLIIDKDLNPELFDWAVNG